MGLLRSKLIVAAALVVVALIPAHAQQPVAVIGTNVLKKELQLKLDEWHKAGKFSGATLGVVLADDDDPRVKLLKEGLAWTAEKNPSEDLEPLRQWAEQKGKGLWKEENPTPPWTYRRQQSMMKPKSS